MKRAELERLSKETLIKLIEVYGKNWLTLDGLWFQGVEEKYSMDAALEIDLRMWMRQPITEAKRIKEALNITDNDMPTILKVIDCMTWSQAYTFEVEELALDRAVFYYPHCRPQDQRVSKGIGELPCRPTGVACFGLAAKVINPTAEVECIFCPPGPHPTDCWCKWQLTIQP